MTWKTPSQIPRCHGHRPQSSRPSRAGCRRVPAARPLRASRPDVERPMKGDRSMRWLACAQFCASAIALAVCGCADRATKPNDHLPPECGSYVVVTTDFTSGGHHPDLGRLPRGGGEGPRVGPFRCGRPLYAGLVYVVNRFGGDNIQILDPAHGFTTIRQIPVGPGSNPHDIAVIAPDRAYVSRYGSDGLLEIDPRTGAARDTISLRRFADGDSIPDMDRLFYQTPYLYIALERIDFGGGTYRPAAPSYLAVLDTRTNTLVDADDTEPGLQAIRLAGLNPSAPMIWDEVASVLLVPEVGVYGSLDGGVERVNLRTRRSVGWLTREEDLGGDLVDFALGPNGRGYATIADLHTSRHSSRSTEHGGAHRRAPHLDGIRSGGSGRHALRTSARLRPDLYRPGIEDLRGPHRPRGLRSHAARPDGPPAVRAGAVGMIRRWVPGIRRWSGVPASAAPVSLFSIVIRIGRRVYAGYRALSAAHPA